VRSAFAGQEAERVPFDHDGFARLGPVPHRVSAVLQVHRTDDGRITITVAAADDESRLHVDDTALVLTVWSESADVVRGRFLDPDSGAVAYFQSSDTSFRQFAQTIHLAVSS
jgi:hypothetical protein